MPTMNLRDDMIAALQRRKPSRVPIWEIEFHAWDNVSGRHLVLGEEFARLSPAEQERAMHANAAIIVAVARQFHYAAVSCPNAYWNQAPGQLAYWVLPGDTRFRQAEILKKMAGDQLLLVAQSGGIMGANYSDEFCLQIMEQPEVIDQRTQEILAWSIGQAKRFRDAGAGAVVSSSDMADNSGPFFNPQQMERWIYPNLTRWSAAMRQLGLFSILHTDGNITRYLERMAASGIDAIQAIDPTAGMNMPEAQRLAAGKTCLCGNIDCGRLLMGTPEEIFTATRNLLLACKDQPLVLGASNAVQREVPLANYRAMIAAWEQAG